jgi:hypothetical protein
MNKILCAEGNTTTRHFDMRIAEALGNLSSAVILQQLHFWSQRKGVGVVIKGARYIYNTFKEWVQTQFTFLSEWQFRNAMQVLRSLGIVEVIRYREKEWNQTNYYHLNYSVLNKWAASHGLKIGGTEEDTPQVETPPIQELKTEEVENIVEPVTTTSTPEITMATREINDPYFGRNQQQEIRERAKKSSVVGISDFKDMNDVRECQKQLTLYFAKSMSPQKAEEKAGWIIRDEQKGTRSQFVQDYLDGKPIGSWCQQEWEIEPGIVSPIFMAYLQSKLRKNEDTHAQALSRVTWALKDAETLPKHWAECKRLIEIQKPRLSKALNSGVNPHALDIPDWIIECFRKEVEIEEIVETAETLSSFAIAQNEAHDQVRKQIDGETNSHFLPTSNQSQEEEMVDASGVISSFTGMSIEPEARSNQNYYYAPEPTEEELKASERPIKKSNATPDIVEHHDAYEIYRPEKIEDEVPFTNLMDGVKGAIKRPSFSGKSKGGSDESAS